MPWLVGAGALAAPAAAGTAGTVGAIGAGTAAGAGLGAGTAVTGAGLGSGAIGTGMTATEMAGGLGASGLSVAPGGGLALGGAGGMAAPMAAKGSGIGSLFSNMAPGGWGQTLGSNLGRMGANTDIGNSLLSPIVTKINETPFLTGNGSGGILGGQITAEGMGSGIGRMAGGFAENSLGKLLGGKPAPPIQAPPPPPVATQPMGASMGAPQMGMPGMVSTTGGGNQDVLAKLRALGLLR